MTPDQAVEMLNKLQLIIDAIETMHDNLAAGIQMLMYVAIAFLVWRVIKVMYSLFGNVFFGGI